jgi:hypothetical protein
MQIKTKADFDRAVRMKAKENEKEIQRALKDWLKFAESAEKFRVYRLDIRYGILGRIVPRYFEKVRIISSEELREFLEILGEALHIELVLKLPKSKYLPEIWSDVYRFDIKSQGYSDYEVIAGLLDDYVGTFEYEIVNDLLRIDVAYQDVVPYAPHSEDPRPWFNVRLTENIEFKRVKE